MYEYPVNAGKNTPPPARAVAKLRGPVKVNDNKELGNVPCFNRSAEPFWLRAFF